MVPRHARCYVTVHHGTVRCGVGGKMEADVRVTNTCIMLCTVGWKASNDCRESRVCMCVYGAVYGKHVAMNEVG